MCRATTRSVRIDLRASEENRARLTMPQVLEVSARDVTDVRVGCDVACESALPPRTDIVSKTGHVRKVPTGDIAVGAKRELLDHLVLSYPVQCRAGAKKQIIGPH